MRELNLINSVYEEAFANEWSKKNKLRSFIQNATAEHDFVCFT